MKATENCFDINIFDHTTTGLFHGTTTPVASLSDSEDGDENISVLHGIVLVIFSGDWQIYFLNKHVLLRPLTQCRKQIHSSWVTPFSVGCDEVSIFST